MELPNTPNGWAVRLTKILNHLEGENRFPVDVPSLARNVSAQFFPEEPITLVKGRDIPGFEGMLSRAPVGKTGWGIFYNSGITSEGRIRFTLAHELGHYLLHRNSATEGIIVCDKKSVTFSDPEHKNKEREADQFATNLLMPLDDFRRQINARDCPTIEHFSMCADRYGVSLIAAIIRWLEYTERRAVMVVSVDGFIDWAKSSRPALQTRAFFKTVNRDPIEIPSASLAANQKVCDDPRQGMRLPKGTWFPSEENIHEMVVDADQYDFTISLLLLSNFSAANIEDDPDDEAGQTPMAF
ncbi:MAG: ImmA/IrrE family metallo-endopeptidase [Magnetococcales bacterium]|nr:ImmA/IrrE family metallo-endopeptidase [Magnetococcales bacterium]